MEQVEHAADGRAAEREARAEQRAGRGLPTRCARDGAHDGRSVERAAHRTPDLLLHGRRRVVEEPRHRTPRARPEGQQQRQGARAALGPRLARIHAGRGGGEVDPGCAEPRARRALGDAQRPRDLVRG